jgi:hypothetical protein
VTHFTRRVETWASSTSRITVSPPTRHHLQLVLMMELLLELRLNLCVARCSALSDCPPSPPFLLLPPAHRCSRVSTFTAGLKAESSTARKVRFEDNS